MIINKDFYINEYDRNYKNFPFLNSNNEQKINNFNNIKFKKSKISGFNANSDNYLYYEDKDKE